MARKDDPEAEKPRGLGDIVGIIFLCLSFLLLVALFTFDRHDLRSNLVPPNTQVHNFVGPVGAYTAGACFFLFGAAAFLFPVLLLGFALAFLFQLLRYLRRRWPWALLLLMATAAMLDLFSDRFRPELAVNLHTPGVGGFVGLTLNQLVFGHFGRVGAASILATIYLISLLGLTSIQLGPWLRERWKNRRLVVSEPEGRIGEDALEQKALRLAHEAEELKREVDRTGLGADLKPVPEPTVRDLSVPPARPSSEGKSPRPGPVPSAKVAEPAVETPPTPVQEHSAASTADILGQATTDSRSKLEPVSAEDMPAEKLEPSLSVPERPTPPSPAVSPSPAPVAKPRPVARKAKPISVAAPPLIGNYQLPSLSLLNLPDALAKPSETKEDLMANARLMQSTLAQFDIEVSLGDITKGPTITRYELHPAPGVKLERIAALNNNIAAALKAERIHILAPVPGKSSVGIEVPNLIKTKVIMRDLLETEEWLTTKARIPLALGKDVYGHPIVSDLSEMPHLLIAGSTGSGKSVCINAIITSLLYRFSPDQLRFVMIDPKVVELQQYNSLPHLVVPVVTDPKKVVLALRWVINEMEKRYQIFAKVGVRNIKSFNDRPKQKALPPQEPELPLRVRKERIEAGSDGFAVELDEEIVVPRDEDIVIPEKLSYIVVIIDELADLMLVAPADVEMAIARITQMARAAGIHCIVATQRPSVDVITGVIKANIPARIAFQVASKVDSRTILDAMGADKLLGKGDMLYMPPGASKLVRAQGALITDQEIQALVEFIARQGKPSYEVDIHQQLSTPDNGFEADGGSDEDEGLIQQCIEVIRSEQKASVSLLQRRLRLGYTRAARIMDELENRGIVGPSKGAEPRDILIDLDGTGADGQPPPERA
jgi:S-DNA-T family DNA segregation ATPase FtsK/SpoIIIE